MTTCTANDLFSSASSKEANFEGHFVKEEYANESLPQFYRPTEMGKEKNIKARLQTLWN